ncbi:MAG: DUF2301 domain-containing membrane protein [Chloroflexaceae bacterium]|nr:DUF2301 domain-containing membrane protein [Chloroflexaceae bacterium]
MVYQGQFGKFTITDADRQGVIVYRAGLVLAALSFAIATALLFWQGPAPWVLQVMTPLFGVFALGLGISLATIHIYMGAPSSLAANFLGDRGAVCHYSGGAKSRTLALLVYHHPLTLLGIGFIFAALTGIYFKEAFCFNRLETKLLTPLVPGLLLGHLLGLIPAGLERGLLAVWAVLFAMFALRKVTQAIPPDIGDKSVFDYLKGKSDPASLQ